MICLEGTGTFSHVSVRNSPDVFNEPLMFAAISIKGRADGAKVLEGPVPTWKYFGSRNTANEGGNKSYGLPRFENADFTACFPFASINLSDKDIHLDYQPWYSGKFANISEAAQYWSANYSELKTKSQLFTDAFFRSILPPEVLEAVSANLTILKSPTVLRQRDGKLWAWEVCNDNSGCCEGSCTHIWNYAQAIHHLFPSLERTLRNTEFNESQNQEGHQSFRTALPIREKAHDFYAASDGQLGGIMNVYREWRISGDGQWLQELFPKVKASMDYCINTWNTRHKGIIEEPHHNTYDIEFLGARWDVYRFLPWCFIVSFSNGRIS